jgi:hypothetical protein
MPCEGVWTSGEPRTNPPLEVAVLLECDEEPNFKDFARDLVRLGGASGYLLLVAVDGMVGCIFSAAEREISDWLLSVLASGAVPEVLSPVGKGG